MEYLWTVLTTLLMYTSAIFYYPMQFIGRASDPLLSFSEVFASFSTATPVDWKLAVMYLNPIFDVITNFRNCIIGDAPFDYVMFAYSTVFSIVCLIFGSILFLKKQNKFILEI